MTLAQFGIVGLGTMGRNFLLNVAEHGYPCVGFDIDASKRKLLIDEGQGFQVAAADDVVAFVKALEKPRRIMLLVPAGAIVDSVIDDLLPSLSKGDILIDGGNSHFIDTERRGVFLNQNGIEFLGVGVSGGEVGARHGASIMIGGKPDVYEHVKPIFEAASAKVDGEPCAAHVGNGSAGHFVKMVHNGIEYGLMQLIAESFDLLRRGFQISDDKAADLFSTWNEGELNSFLIEITSVVLRKKDKDGLPLVEKILDTAGQKGTGKWTSQAAMDLGVPIPTIDSAVSMRQISARKVERVIASEKLGIVQDVQLDETLAPDTIGFIESALRLSFLVTFAQGFSMLQAADKEKSYELDMAEIAKIWRGGCIIRAKMLEQIRGIFEANPENANLLIVDTFKQVIRNEHGLLKAAVKFAISADVPCMAFATSLNYLKSYSSKQLPANLIQAQRDLFGAHTYQRVDSEDTFHTSDWNA
ncbi:MAG: NADP-dependent phosphogluconate dehydrogenase [Pyrinomonadaceae bacterium]